MTSATGKEGLLTSPSSTPQANKPQTRAVEAAAADDERRTIRRRATDRWCSILGNDVSTGAATDPN